MPVDCTKSEITNDSRLDMDPEQPCWQGSHIGYIIFAVSGFVGIICTCVLLNWNYE